MCVDDQSLLLAQGCNILLFTLRLQCKVHWFAAVCTVVHTQVHCDLQGGRGGNRRCDCYLRRPRLVVVSLVPSSVLQSLVRKGGCKAQQGCHPMTFKTVSPESCR